MSASTDPDVDPLAALPLLREAGVSVSWQALDGRTAWVADPATRQVWISRSVPRELLLHCLVEALGVLDAAEPAPPAPRRAPLRLVHAGPGDGGPPDRSRSRGAALRVLDGG
ncbi:hypothetical protein [Actinomycetospora sp. TBRC 11914]|uniref:hypothetical protein n=1 Tax=Actinomycetospora sp. TBRC 11914 TaxID=2729387 RepID=UPI00145DF543|nr:hypothetical protein [Actinomycetospora sp. TBRC 11914]NMO89619.1 hypothetical protein [Actinomycetospora sp. TBRC 11914]